MYISDKQVAARFGITRVAVWKWVREMGFPAPYKLTPGCTRWKVADIEAWEQSRSQMLTAA